MTVPAPIFVYIVQEEQDYTDAQDTYILGVYMTQKEAEKVADERWDELTDDAPVFFKAEVYIDRFMVGAGDEYERVKVYGEGE